jgi:hypothetical protein
MLGPHRMPVKAVDETQPDRNGDETDAALTPQWTAP